uniref:Uncharacterized protein n=1 Tax=Serinus canaria TaxID=9135 RepID=A0A8C9UGH5_SERCA
MASVASVAVELYEFCFFLLPFPHGIWEAAPQSKVSCLMYGLRSTAVHNLFKICLSELMELTEQPTNTSIRHGYVHKNHNILRKGCANVGGIYLKALCH